MISRSFCVGKNWSPVRVIDLIEEREQTSQDQVSLFYID